MSGSESGCSPWKRAETTNRMDSSWNRPPKYGETRPGLWDIFEERVAKCHPLLYSLLHSTLVISATAEQSQAAIESLVALRARIADRLDSATPEDRRRVLEVLDTRITLTETGGLDISIGVPDRADCVHQSQGRCTQSALSSAFSSMGTDAVFRFNLAI